MLFGSRLLILSFVLTLANVRADQPDSLRSLLDRNSHPEMLGFTAVQLQQTSDPAAAVNESESDAKAKPNSGEKLTPQQRRLMIKRSQLRRLGRPVSSLDVRQVLGQSLGPSDEPANDLPLGMPPTNDLSSPPRLVTANASVGIPSLQQATLYERRPLYFEDAALERCEQSSGHRTTGFWTNGKSAIKFFSDTARWPFQMIRLHPNKTIATVAK